MKPNFRFLFSHPYHFIACGFGSGLSPFAPGTAGTLAAWVMYWPLRYLIPHEIVFIGFIAIAFLIGIYAADRTGRDLGVSDDGSIVWDEIVPFWCVLLFTPTGLVWQLAAFLLFRFFDIVKPQPARWLDTHMKNGVGVMADDAVAAAYTVLVILSVKHAMHLWV